MVECQVNFRGKMPSYLITGGKPSERIQTIKNAIKKTRFALNLEQNFEKHPDLLLITAENSIGIDQIRQLKNHLSLKPLEANFKIALLPQAEKLTIPAQNAMLKLLEEPPQNDLIFLSSPSRNQLLPTIISRCHLIHLQEKTEIEVDKETINFHLSALSQALEASPGKRISQANEIAQKGREEAVLFCQQRLVILRSLLLQKLKVERPQFPNRPGFPPLRHHLSQLSPLGILNLLSETQKTLKYLKSNVNPKLALEHLFLSLPQPGDKISSSGPLAQR